jgi:RNA polymerase sigma-70 factor (ECF subfamily)
MIQPTKTEPQSAATPGTLQSIFPFLPRVFSSQSAVPALVAAEQELLQAITAFDGVLDPNQRIQLMHAAIRVPAGPEPGPSEVDGVGSTLDPVLETFGTKLSSSPMPLSPDDIKWLTESGLASSALIEAVCAVAMAQFLLTLAKSSDLDLEWRSIVSIGRSKLPRHSKEGPKVEPLLVIPPLEPEELKHSYSILREQYGFVPNLVAIQSHCPEIVNAQVKVLDTLLFGEDHLSRVQKELIVLRLATLDFNTYLVTMQVSILALLGIGADQCDQIIDALPCALLSQAEQILLEEVGKLSLFSNADRASFNRSRLREHGFTDSQIIEGAATAAFTNFLCVIQFGLNPAPDFPPHRIFTPKDLYPLDARLRPTSDDSLVDPDSSLVAQVKAGNTELFAELVRRHTRRVFGALAGILGNVDDARDSTQDVFLKAFQHIGNFQGRSKFSTWIMSIAVNTGTELLRQRRPTESLDDTDEESSFRPRQIRSWVEDPEQQLAKAQIDDLVRQGVLRLPEKYRIALLLRDINQIPTEEAAAALNLSVPALKARVLRGRLMLRESLTPHFSHSREEGHV